MVKCELCGAEIRGPAYRVILDGAEMVVCPRCAKGKTVVGTLSVGLAVTPRRTPRSPPLPQRRREDIEEYIIDGYGEVIRQARERMGLTRELLALMVGEKESTIRRIEAGQLEPPISLARKLEKVLKVKLVEQYNVEEGYSESSTSRDFEVTLGDIAEFKDDV